MLMLNDEVSAVADFVAEKSFDIHFSLISFLQLIQT